MNLPSSLHSPSQGNPQTTFSAQVDAKQGASAYRPAPSLTELLRYQAQHTYGPTLGDRVKDTFVEKAIQTTNHSSLKKSYLKCLDGTRLTPEDALLLLKEGDLNVLGTLAQRQRNQWHDGAKASYLIDRNINYTNVCRIGCDFCAFYRTPKQSDAYVLPNEVVLQKIQETVDHGGTGVLLQGGVNPQLKLDYYLKLFSQIKEKFHIHLHALSVIEIENIAQISRLSVKETIQELVAAGLDSIPGAGAEILVDEVRLHQSPVKRHAHRWIDTMLTAHELDLPTTATMMFGALEEPRHVIQHLDTIRKAQDISKGFYAFILWTFQGENTELLKNNPQWKPMGSYDYLKVLAVSRLFLDNIPNLQGSWVTMSPKIGQLSLHYGANDMGSIMIEENVVSAAGTAHSLTGPRMRDLVACSGFEPFQRDTYFRDPSLV
jgi:cyclic dehypoxanthinyl futalosine synthase